MLIAIYEIYIFLLLPPMHLDCDHIARMMTMTMRFNATMNTGRITGQGRGGETPATGNDSNLPAIEYTWAMMDNISGTLSAISITTVGI